MGAGTGPVWVDVHIRSPLYVVMGIVTALSWLIMVVPSLRSPMGRLADKAGRKNFPAPVQTLGAMAAILLVFGIITLTVLPAIFQKFKVEHNEITLEKPYIENNKTLFSNVRLWDWRVLEQLFEDRTELLDLAGRPTPEAQSWM
jgi:uncharacterized protein